MKIALLILFSLLFGHVTTAFELVRDWSLLIPRTGAEGNIIFLQKIHNPSKFLFKFSYPTCKSSKNFTTQHVQAFYVLTVFTIFTNPIENGFNDK